MINYSVSQISDNFAISREIKHGAIFKHIHKVAIYLMEKASA